MPLLWGARSFRAFLFFPEKYHLVNLAILLFLTNSDGFKKPEGLAIYSSHIVSIFSETSSPVH